MQGLARLGGTTAGGPVQISSPPRSVESKTTCRIPATCTLGAAGGSRVWRLHVAASCSLLPSEVLMSELQYRVVMRCGYWFNVVALSAEQAKRLAVSRPVEHSIRRDEFVGPPGSYDRCFC